MKFDSIWIVSPLNYPHFCFDEVAIGLRSAAKELGSRVPITRGMRAETARPLILGACLLKGEDALPDDAIIFNLEQYPSPWFTPLYLRRLREHQVFDYDPANALALRELGIDVHLCPIGYAPELSCIQPDQEEDIDVLFYGSLNRHRQKIIENLSARKVKAGWITAYGVPRDHAIARAKIVLNVHYYPAARFESVRCSYLLANGKCIVSERCATPEAEETFPCGIAWADYDGLADKCIELLEDPEHRLSIAARGFATFSQMKQVDYLRTALAGLREEAIA